MADAFTAGMATIFADRNLSRAAIYLGTGITAAVPCRAIAANPTSELNGLGQLRASATQRSADILQSDVADKPIRGGSLVIDESGRATCLTLSDGTSILGSDGSGMTAQVALMQWKIEDVTADARNLRWHLVLSGGQPYAG